MVATLCFVTGIGFSVRFTTLPRYRSTCFFMSLIKFVFIPITVVGIAYLCGLGTVAEGRPLKVALVLSAMPVAMNALILPSLYHLDIDLANACWVFTTTALLVILPLLMGVLAYIK